MRCEPHPFAVAVQLIQGKLTPGQLDEEQIREVVKYLHREEKWGKKQIADFFGIRHRPLVWVEDVLGKPCGRGVTEGKAKQWPNTER